MVPWSTVYESKSGICYCSSVTAAPDKSGYAQTYVIIAETIRRYGDLGHLKIFKLYPCVEKNSDVSFGPGGVPKPRKSNSKPKLGKRIKRKIKSFLSGKPIIELEQVYKSTCYTIDWCHFSVTIGVRHLAIAWYSKIYWLEGKTCTLYAFDLETMQPYQASPETLPTESPLYMDLNVTETHLIVTKGRPAPRINRLLS
ncbi:hypothetical protein BJ138DRAFT_442065 [Hygrophoropsis aurantiaca]|uniref:Uncharacterized protein n=1 Tax=Hygrophoropsis aurantiaca TaxID=72124 RepID=A0ACB8A452_9AGAM|nr:hypothetical protein BJ138DRAFT_442065 [Hygrophoropsis aurantiaca]